MDIIKLVNEFKQSGYPAKLKYQNTVIVINSWSGSFEVLKSRSRDMFFVSRFMIIDWFCFCAVMVQILVNFSLQETSTWLVSLLVLSSIWTFVRIIKGHFYKKTIEQFLAEKGILL